jgi:hypothetical protein
MDGIDRFDLVVSDEKRSLRSYHGLLGPVGYVRLGVIAGERGERGERGAYLNRVTGGGWVSIRQRQSDAHPLRMSDTRSGSTTSPSPPPSRVVVDERAGWVAQQGATIESGPAGARIHAGLRPGGLLRPRSDQAGARPRPAGPRSGLGRAGTRPPSCGAGVKPLAAWPAYGDFRRTLIIFRGADRPPSRPMRGAY